MKRILAPIFAFFMLFLAACAPAAPASTPTPIPTASAGAAAVFTLSSPAFANGAAIPNVYSCNGENTSPALAWNEPPAGTKTFAIIMDDPDADKFTHWMIYNIPANIRGLSEAVKTGRDFAGGVYQGLNSEGSFSYTGPCPPAQHHYSFKLYALDTTLTKEQGVGEAVMIQAMAGHILAESELTGTYKP